jgi:hypothetical protein
MNFPWQWISTSEGLSHGIKKEHKESFSSDSENAGAKIDDSRISNLLDLCRHLFVVRDSLHYLFRVIGGYFEKGGQDKARAFESLGENRGQCCPRQLGKFDG